MKHSRDKPTLTTNQKYVVLLLHGWSVEEYHELSPRRPWRVWYRWRCMPGTGRAGVSDTMYTGHARCVIGGYAELQHVLEGR